MNLRVDRAQSLERIDEVRLLYRILRGFGEGDERVECRRGRQCDGAEKRRPGCAFTGRLRHEQRGLASFRVADGDPRARRARAESECAAATLSITAFASACPMRYVCTPGVPSPGVVTRYDREVLCEQRAHFPHRIQIVSEIRRDGRRALIAEPGRSVRPGDDGPSRAGATGPWERGRDRSRRCRDPTDRSSGRARATRVPRRVVVPGSSRRARRSACRVVRRRAATGPHSPCS